MKKTFTIILLTLAMLIGSAYATVTTPANRHFETITGGTLVVSEKITAVDRGFNVANLDIPARGTSQDSPGVFDSGVSANTEIKAGDWELTFELRTTQGTPPSTVFIVKLNLVEAPEGQTFATLYISTDAGGAGQLLIVAFSAGPSLGTPLSYTFTVERM